MVTRSELEAARRAGALTRYTSTSLVISYHSAHEASRLWVVRDPAEACAVMLRFCMGRTHFSDRDRVRFYHPLSPLEFIDPAFLLAI